MLVPVETEISRPASQPNLKWSWQLPLHSFFRPSGVCYLSWRPHFLSSVPGKRAKKPPLSCVLLPNSIQIWLSWYFCFNVFFPIKSNNKLVEIFLGGKWWVIRTWWLVLDLYLMLSSQACFPSTLPAAPGLQIMSHQHYFPIPSSLKPTVFLSTFCSNTPSCSVPHQPPSASSIYLWLYHWHRFHLSIQWYYWLSFSGNQQSQILESLCFKSPRMYASKTSFF